MLELLNEIHTEPTLTSSAALAGMPMSSCKPASMVNMTCLRPSELLSLCRSVERTATLDPSSLIHFPKNTRDILKSIADSGLFVRLMQKNWDDTSAVVLCPYDKSVPVLAFVGDADAPGPSELSILQWLITAARVALKKVYESSCLNMDTFTAGVGATSGERVGGQGSQGAHTPDSTPALAFDVSAATRELQALRKSLEKKSFDIFACLRDYKKLEACLYLLDTYRMQMQTLVDKVMGELAVQHASRLGGYSGFTQLQAASEDAYLLNLSKLFLRQIDAENRVTTVAAEVDAESTEYINTSVATTSRLRAVVQTAGSKSHSHISNRDTRTNHRLPPLLSSEQGPRGTRGTDPANSKASQGSVSRYGSLGSSFRGIAGLAEDAVSAGARKGAHNPLWVVLQNVFPSTAVLSPTKKK